MGNNPLNWEDPGRFLPLSGLSDGEDVDKEGHDGQVGLPIYGQGNEGSGSGGG